MVCQSLKEEDERKLMTCPRLGAQRDEEKDGGEAVQDLTGLQFTLHAGHHIRARPFIEPMWPHIN
jgi:hypothetical protein